MFIFLVLKIIHFLLVSGEAQFTSERSAWQLYTGAVNVYCRRNGTIYMLFVNLRLLSECLILIGSTIFDATFNLVTRVGIFGTLKDGSLQIKNSAFNNCFRYRNVF